MTEKELDGIIGTQPQVLVIMGVSGVGKTTIAEKLVERLHSSFQEGDDLHPPANREKMRSGQPLNDEDRQPWLNKIAAWIDTCLKSKQLGIIACSALKRAYRRTIVGENPNVCLIYLKASKDVLKKQIHKRKGHWMPETLLESQLQTLEEPGSDENCITVVIHESVDETVESIIKQLRSG